MNDLLAQLTEYYTVALQEYLAGGGEAALQRAYDLGRRAIAQGLGVLDVVQVYQESLVKALQRAPTLDESTRIAKLASSFFAESISPFEMTHRGFQEAITALSHRTVESTKHLIDETQHQHAENFRHFAMSVQRAQETERQRLTRELRSKKTAETLLVGQSPVIREIRTAIQRAADSEASVLVMGESGTGKEVVANLIHHQSERADKPFLAINCAALPKDVIENELFGHEKGAFTGALSQYSGCFELADQGTLFFDEIAEMPPETQAKLLRAVELKSFRRLGGDKEEIKVDVRTIAATNRNVQTALESGQLRGDLYYRLSVIEILMPPLRDRKEDIPPLVEHFLRELREKYKKPQYRFSDECLELLSAFDWPGNVRELRNIVERAMINCPDKVISPRYLPARISMQNSISIPLGSSTQDVERLLILQTLAAVSNNKSKAARILGLNRKTLQNKLREFFQS